MVSSPSHHSDLLSTAMGSRSPSSKQDSMAPLWRPGSTSYPVAKKILDPVSSKAELNKLYEAMTESAYDLSLKDLVDPAFSICGEPIAQSRNDSVEALNKEGESRKKQHRQRKKRPYLYYLLLGNRDGMLPRLKVDDEKASPMEFPLSPLSRTPKRDLKRDPLLSLPSSLVLKERFSLANSPSPQTPHANGREVDRNSSCHNHQQKLSSICPKIHPFNHCSHCASYTLFFKIHCTVCGKVYCNNCAKETTEDIARYGGRCKGSCGNPPLSRTFVEKVRKVCRSPCRFGCIGN